LDQAYKKLLDRRLNASPENKRYRN